MTNKSLIFHNLTLNPNQGGPSGYINKCLINNKGYQITLSINAQKPFRQLDLLVKYFYVLEYIKSRIFKRINVLGSLQFYSEDRKMFIKSEAAKYKILFFHDVFTLYNVIDLINNHQIVVLQSHSPVLPFEELFGLNNKILTEQLQSQLFKRANYLIFPNLFSQEEYTRVLFNQKIKYLCTGIKDIDCYTNFKLDSRIVKLLFIGRRNSIKGFDFLIETFVKVRKVRKDIVLYLIGDGERIIEDGIIDIGFSTQVYDWINSVDFVVSPNRKSYFDLNVLESLQIGTPLIMTTTQGHSCFQNVKGIISFEFDSLESILLNKDNVNTDWKSEHSSSLKSFFDDRFQQTTFLENLRKIIDEIEEENQ